MGRGARKAAVEAVAEEWRVQGEGIDPQSMPLTRLAFAAIDVVTPKSYTWEWPKAFEQVGLDRLIDLGAVTKERARTMAQEFAARSAAPNSLVIAPAVLEIIAVRR